MNRTAFPKVSIFGIPVSQMSMQATAAYLTKVIVNKGVHGVHLVITANPIMVMTALENADYMAMMKRADLIVPDGAGIVWAAGYVGNPVAERVPGFELLHELLKTGGSYGWKVYFIGASPEVIQETVSRVKKQYPGIEISGHRDGYFDTDRDDEVIAEIQRAQPDLLFVGRSVDKQEPWLDRYRDRLNVPVMMGVGGSFDVIAGKLKRAPFIFRKLRLEWLYRLLREPWRYRRMLALPKFAVKVLRERENVQKSSKEL